jgi:hypothetical protein
MTSGQRSIIPDEREGVGGLRFSGRVGCPDASAAAIKK